MSCRFFWKRSSPSWSDDRAPYIHKNTTDSSDVLETRDVGRGAGTDDWSQKERGGVKCVVCSARSSCRRSDCRRRKLAAIAGDDCFFTRQVALSEILVHCKWRGLEVTIGASYDGLRSYSRHWRARLRRCRHVAFSSSSLYCPCACVALLEDHSPVFRTLWRVHRSWFLDPSQILHTSVARDHEVGGNLCVTIGDLSTLT